MLARYALVARAQGLSPKTINHTTRTVRFFHTFLGDPKDVRSIQADDLRRFILADQQRDRWPGRARRLQKLSPTSINTYVRAIKGYWSWMKREGLVEHDSLKEVVPPKLAHRLPKTFSEEELKQVFAVVTNQPREKAMLSLFLDSGITLQEIISLKTSDLNLNEGNAHVFREKTARERYVCFSPPTALNIERYLLQRPEHWQDDHLFLTRDGQPLQPHRVQEILVRVGRKAGLTQRLSPHKLRHTFATLSLKYGSNLEYIRIQLGHSDIKTTSESYLNVADADIARAHRKFSPVANLFVAVDNIKSMESENQEAQSKRKTYDETPHKRQMRELAKATAAGIRLPSPWDKVLWRDLPVEFKPGKYYLPIGAVEIGEDKQIKVNYYDIGAGIAEPHLVKGLFSHLSTSGSSKFMELVGDKGKLNDLVFKAGQYSQALLNFLKLITDELKGYRAQLDFHDEGKPGLTKWFIISAWNDAIQKAGGYSWIDNSWYKPYESVPGTNLWQLRVGGAVIGIAKSKRTLNSYETWHKKLILKYATDPLAKDIAVKDQELGIIAQDVKQRLQEFSDMQQVPGHCELC